MNEKKIRLPIGESDFRILRNTDCYYVDKTMFIHEIIEGSSKVFLIPRPRRFGKTLNLSMLRYFFEKSDEDRRVLFKGTAVEDTESFEAHQGKYPVIYLTFKDIKESSWERCYRKLMREIGRMYREHREVLTGSPRIDETDRDFIRRITDGSASPDEYEDALKELSRYLHECSDNAPVILIDEYDTPVHAAYAGGYYKEMIAFMRNFLSGGFKDNIHLFRGVITGILRIAKESIFSGLNNLGVYTLLSPRFSEAFGFTDPEVKAMIRDYGFADQYEAVSYWYNGYRFGNTVIYNPWSVMNYIDNFGKPGPYWINTASTDIIDSLATRGGRELREEIGQLLEGKSITKPVYESIVMRDLEKQDNLLWSFLLFSGYLKPVEQVDEKNFRLKIPNHEVEIMYQNLVENWFNEKIESDKVGRLLKALQDGDIEVFESLLSDMVEKVLSIHDTARPEPEQFYHAFVLGLLVWLENKYEVRSNREAGLGRYDVALIPKDRTKQGIIMEFKKVNTRRNETPEQALEKALKQIEDRKYAAELESAGIRNILSIAIAFRGKELWMKMQEVTK